MQICSYYGLDPQQVPFLDVDFGSDTQNFLDPFRARALDNDLSKAIVEGMDTFWDLGTISPLKLKQMDVLRENWSHVHELNLLHIGYSDKNRGSGVGEKKAFSIEEILRLMHNRAGKLPGSLEEAILLTHGIGPDGLSDIIGNVCKKSFAEFTTEMCVRYKGIRSQEFHLGLGWNPSTQVREKVTGICPVNFETGGPVLLVPKWLVSGMEYYSMKKVYDHGLLVILQEMHLAQNSNLVVTLKNGDKVVYKKDIKQVTKYVYDIVYDMTQGNPAVLRKYYKYISKKVAKDLESLGRNVSEISLREGVEIDSNLDDQTLGNYGISVTVKE